MSSNRTYRAARPRSEVLNEIRRCAGTQFDPKFAKVFIDQVDLSAYDEMSDHHRFVHTMDTGEAA